MAHGLNSTGNSVLNPAQNTFRHMAGIYDEFLVILGTTLSVLGPRSFRIESMESKGVRSLVLIGRKKAVSIVVLNSF